jgi:hypothetical protein
MSVLMDSKEIMGDLLWQTRTTVSQPFFLGLAQVLLADSRP